MKKKDKDTNSPVFPNEIEQYMKNEEKNKVYVVADKVKGRFQLWSNKKYRKFDNMKILDLDIRYLEDFNVEKKGSKYIFSFMDKKTRKTMRFFDKENPIRIMNTLIHYKQCLGLSNDRNENLIQEKRTFSEENIKINLNGKHLPNNQSCPKLSSPLSSPRQQMMPSSTTSPRQSTSPRNSSPNIQVNMQMMQMIQMYQMNPILLQQINPQMYQQIHTVHNQMNQISSMNNNNNGNYNNQFQQMQMQQQQQFSPLSPRSFGNVCNTFNQMNNQQKEGSLNNKETNLFQNPKSNLKMSIHQSSSSVPNTPISTSPNMETSLLSKTPPKMKIVPSNSPSSLSNNPFSSSNSSSNLNLKFNSTPSSPRNERNTLNENNSENKIINKNNTNKNNINENNIDGNMIDKNIVDYKIINKNVMKENVIIDDGDSLNPFLSSSYNSFNPKSDLGDKEDVDDRDDFRRVDDSQTNNTNEVEKEKIKLDKNLFNPFVSLSSPLPNLSSHSSREGDSSEILSPFSCDSPIVESIHIDLFPKSEDDVNN